MRLFLCLFALEAIVVSALSAGPIPAVTPGLSLSTSVIASTGGSFYGPLGTTQSSTGSSTASLDYSGAGPISGSYSFTGSANAVFGTLKANASVSATGYGAGSYNGIVDSSGTEWLQTAGSARAAMTDQVTLSGSAPQYDVVFSFKLAGTTTSDGRPAFTAMVTPQFEFSDGGAVDILAATELTPDDGSIDDIFTVVAADVPTGTVLSLTQSLTIQLLANEEFTVVDNNPFSDGDFGLSHIVGTGSNISADSYAVNFGADFGHSMVLRSVTILDSDGNDAAGARLLSQSHHLYSVASTPEPSTFVLVGAGLGLAALLRRKR
jgi:hypothetical protein